MFHDVSTRNHDENHRLSSEFFDSSISKNIKNSRRSLCSFNFYDGAFNNRWKEIPFELNHVFGTIFKFYFRLDTKIGLVTTFEYASRNAYDG